MTKIILQGLPGIGKTTLTKKIANRLQEMAIEVSGFYTEEIRNNQNYRIGFDIVTLDNKRGVLARKSNLRESRFKVGSYNVNIDDFEKIALPILENKSSVLVIDEIGKMELFSEKFESNIDKIMTDESVKVIATVPLKGGAPLIQRLKNDESNHLITVTPTNRDKLLDEIIPLIIK